MVLRINDLTHPDDKRVANYFDTDGTKGVISQADMDAAKARIDSGGVRLAARFKAAFDRLAAKFSESVSPGAGVDPSELEGASPGGTEPTIWLGPDSVYASQTSAPKNDLRTESISFVTARNPNGLTLKRGQPVVLPRVHNSEGVVGYRLKLKDGSARSVFARVGQTTLNPFTGSLRAGTAPVHGPIRLNANREVTLESIDVIYYQPIAGENTDYYPVQTRFVGGDTYEIDLPESRRGKPIDQVEFSWTANYHRAHPTKKSDEGKPIMLDGIYAQAYVVDGTRENRIYRKVFVDVNEVDNFHDLPGPTGNKLRVKFSSKESGGNIQLRYVRVRYKDTKTPETESFNRWFDPGERASMELPRSARGKRIVRVEVKWSDFKGDWHNPGYARGRLVVDGKQVGPWEGVQKDETQTFTFLHGLRSHTGKIGFDFQRDPTKVSWIKVYLAD